MLQDIYFDPVQCVLIRLLFGVNVKFIQNAKNRHVELCARWMCLEPFSSI